MSWSSWVYQHPQLPEFQPPERTSRTVDSSSILVWRSSKMRWSIIFACWVLRSDGGVDVVGLTSKISNIILQVYSQHSLSYCKTTALAIAKTTISNCRQALTERISKYDTHATSTCTWYIHIQTQDLHFINLPTPPLSAFNSLLQPVEQADKIDEKSNKKIRVYRG